MADRKHIALAFLLFAAFSIIYYNAPSKPSPTGPEPDNAPSPQGERREINRTLVLMDAWLVRDLNPEGYFNYEYHPPTGGYSKDNNMIRQLMASRTLAERSSVDERLRGLHKRNLDYVFTHWYRSDGDRGYILFDNDSRLGANAMALRAIVSSPYYDEYRVEAKALSNGLLHLQNPNGSFKPYYVEPAYPYDGSYVLSFYSGEALLGLIDYYEKTHDELILQAAIKSQDYYVGEYADRMDENYCPFYVPWHTMTLYRLHNITGNQRYAEAAFKLNDRLIRSQEPSGRFVDIYDLEYGQPHSAVVALYVDGLTYAYDLALACNDSARERAYGLGIRRGLTYLTYLQYTDENDTRTYGALKADSSNGMVRVDATQHAIDAFRRALKLYSANTNLSHGSG